MREIAVDYVEARGHPNVRGTHPTTFEITKEEGLTPRGDCIIGVGANKGAHELSEELKEVLRKDDSLLLVILKTEKHMDYVLARGSSALTMEDPSKIIIRKSAYVNGATVAIMANKAAADIDRGLIADMKEGGRLLVFFIAVLP